jgi:hypothetical protein
VWSVAIVGVECVCGRAWGALMESANHGGAE